jgi:hypothetical protein
VHTGRVPTDVSSQEAVMSEANTSEANLFREYATKAIDEASTTTDENEKRRLMDLACMWAQAALMSERVLGSSFTSSPRDVGH